MGQWIWVIKDLGVLIWWKRNWKKKRVLQKRKWKKKHAILKITLINKTRQKEPHPFHPPYIYQNLHSKCIWQTWKIFVNTQNIITEVTNNVVIPLLSVSQKKNLPPPLHSVLILTVKLVTMNENKRCPFCLQLRWVSLRVLFLSFLSILFSFWRGGEKSSISLLWFIHSRRKYMFIKVTLDSKKISWWLSCWNYQLNW